MAIINKVRYVLRKDSLITLYASSIEPHMTYCVDVWGNVNKNNLNPLYVRHECLIHLITKCGYLDHTANLCQSLNILPFFM